VRILVLRGGALGDLILTIPALLALRGRFAGATIRLIGAFPHAALGASHCVDEVEDVNAPSLIPLFGSGENLDSLRPRFSSIDLVINYLSDPDRHVESNLRRLGAWRIVNGPPRPIEKKDLGHASFQLFAPLMRLGIEWTGIEPFLDWGSAMRVAGRIAFHIGSGSRAKNWPLDRWSQLIAENETGATAIYLIGGEADRSRLDFLKRSVGSKKIRFVENQPLNQVADLLATCVQFIGHDSGISHLAALLGTPTVALFGPTDSRIWAPRGRNVTVVQSRDRCMESITIETVCTQMVLNRLAARM
jgi:heptosyltransferase III